MIGYKILIDQKETMTNMKSIIIYIFISLLIFASSCDKEDIPFAQPKKNKYDLSKGEEGSVQREIYDFYQKYNCIIITESDSSDYRYNFNSINEVTLKNPEEENIKSGIAFMKEVWLNKFPEKFMKEHLPFSLILCDRIINKKNKEVNAFASYNFLAMGKINGDYDDLENYEKSDIFRELTFELLYNNMFKYKGDLKFPNKFFAVSHDFYNKSDYLKGEKSYILGFVENTYNTSHEDDTMEWLNFLTEKTQEEIDEMRNDFPRIEEKYQVLKSYFKAEFGIEITDLCRKFKKVENPSPFPF